MHPQFHFSHLEPQNCAAIPKSLMMKKLKWKETVVLKETVKISYFASGTKMHDHLSTRS